MAQPAGTKKSTKIGAGVPSVPNPYEYPNTTGGNTWVAKTGANVVSALVNAFKQPTTPTYPKANPSVSAAIGATPKATPTPLSTAIPTSTGYKGWDTSKIGTPKTPSTGGTSGTGGTGEVVYPTGGETGYPEFAYPEFGGYQFNMPEMPQEYTATPEDIANFYAQATAEAVLQFDPQVLDIQQTLATSLQATSQSGSGLESQYEAVIKSVNEWQAQAIKDEQQRWFARGLGVGGGLVQAETDIQKTAGEEIATAGKEKATKLADIEAQKLLLTTQAGQKETQVKANKLAYVEARRQEIQDQYIAQKNNIAQQNFNNQIAVTQLGLSAEAQAFDQYMQQMSMANEIWYQGKTMALEELKFASDEKYKAESLANSKQTGTKTQTYPLSAENIAAGIAGQPVNVANNQLFAKWYANQNTAKTASYQEQVNEAIAKRDLEAMNAQTNFGGGQYYNLTATQGTSYWNPVTKKYEVRP